MNLDHDLFQVSKLSEDQKKNNGLLFPRIQMKTKKNKKVFTKNETLFSQI